MEQEYVHDNAGNTTLINRFANGDSTVYTIDYYKSGKMRSKCQRVNNVQTGDCIWWYESGKLFAKGEFSNGKPVGDHIIYHESNGEIREITTHNSDGTYKRSRMWYDNQTKESKLKYDHGVLLWRKYWDINGKAIKKEWYDSSQNVIRVKSF